MARDFEDDDQDRPSQRRSGGGRRSNRDMIDLDARPSSSSGRRSQRDREDDDQDDRDDRRDRDRDRDEAPRGTNQRRRSETRNSSRDNDDDRDADDDSRDDDRRKSSGGRSDQDGDKSRSDKNQTDKNGDAKDGQQDGDKKSDDKNKKDGDKKDGSDKDDKKGDDDGQTSRKSRRPLILAIVAVVLLLGVGFGVYYYLSHRNEASTDDAYTDGNVVTIAPQVSGQVISLEVNDNQFVHKGDVLVRIDPRQFQYDREQAQGTLDAEQAQAASQALGVEIAKKNFPASLALAKANLESAQANLVLQKSNYDRQKSLPKQATTQQEVDAATSNFQQAQAQVDQAEARVTQAEPVQQNIGQSQQQVSQIQGQVEQAKGRVDQTNLNVEWSVVRAPQDGWVTRRNVNAGNYVSAGTQIMALVTTDVWVTANFKETQLDGMHPGQQVTVSVDAYPDLNLRGHLDSVQHGSGSRFSAFPAENATGNFIKIVQRVPVKIVIDSGLKADEPLPLGVSVVPTVMLK